MPALPESWRLSAFVNSWDLMGGRHTRCRERLARKSCIMAEQFTRRRWKGSSRAGTDYLTSGPQAEESPQARSFSPRVSWMFSRRSRTCLRSGDATCVCARALTVTKSGNGRFVVFGLPERLAQLGSFVSMWSPDVTVITKHHL